LDALEYAPQLAGVPTSGGKDKDRHPIDRGLAEDTVGGVETRHIFKIVTTKRTLLLSAPSETEEIKWLSTVRALIARRAAPCGQGQVPVGSGSGAPMALAGVQAPLAASKSVSGGHGEKGERHSRQRSQSSV
jgi:hypothetical protein